MTNKVRLGFAGANVNSVWAGESHFPAIRAHPDVEMHAVCTTRQESAEEAKKEFGAKLAFKDYREMVKSPEVDAVVAVVRVPAHFEVAKAAIEAGKPVYIEWPLGRTTAEAEELVALARARGVLNVVGLQSRVSPSLMYARELIQAGHIGELISAHATSIRGGPIERPSSRTHGADVNWGGNPLTVHTGHCIDTLEYVCGDFARLSCGLSTQVKQWYETDTKRWIDVTAPDNIMVGGWLQNGAAAAVHVNPVPYAGSGYRMEIYGREGAMIITGDISSQRGKPLRLQVAQKAKKVTDLEVPDRFRFLPPEFPRDDPYNVGHMYHLLAEAIRTGKTKVPLPDFAHALKLHRLLDVMRESSAQKRELAVTGR